MSRDWFLQFQGKRLGKTVLAELLRIITSPFFVKDDVAKSPYLLEQVERTALPELVRRFLMWATLAQN